MSTPRSVFRAATVMDSIYLDNNSTTPLLPAVLEAMQPFLTEVYGNPASAHRTGSRARKALENSREKIASLLGAHADEVVLTSGATEANNIAILGLVDSPPGHVLVSSIEHPSVMGPMDRLRDRGFEVDALPIDTQGTIHPPELSRRVRRDTALVAVMLANHEVGAVQPVAQLAECVGPSCTFHCDATQAVGKVSVNFHVLGVSTLSLSAHKLHGPKGIGALLVHRDTTLRGLMAGGHQQQGRRPGTEPVALAVGLACALSLAIQEMAPRTSKVTRLRKLFLDYLLEHVSPIVLNGSSEGIPHTLNLSFPGCQADALLMSLDLAGVECSTGSACSSGSLLPSPVLKAMQAPDDVLQSAMRFSFSPLLQEAEVNEAARRVTNVVNRLKELKA